jgi:hypothetical protein
MKLLRVLLVLAILQAAGFAHALTTTELQRFIKAAAKPDSRYEEVRESPWLASPVTTRGTLHVMPDALEKRVESPRPESWRLLRDRVEWKGPAGAVKQILFVQAPGLQALADVTRNAVAGDLQAMERDFHVVVTGDENVWTVQLRPRDAALQRQLESVELQGTRGQVRVLIVTERQGERTTTRILP